MMMLMVFYQQYNNLMTMLIDVHIYLILLNHRLSLLTTAYVMLLMTK